MKTNMITSGAVGLTLAALLFAGCTDSQSTSVSQYDGTGTKPAIRTQAETATTGSEADEPADYDFSDAQVANVSNQQLNEWMNEVNTTLESSKAGANDEQKEGLEELSERAEEVSEDLASLDTEDMNQPADPEMVKDVLEVQVEVGEYAERL
ncbi:MAG: hypothetical protein KC800_14185 [Candidatus Eremiobacteraeota bacterium]|nr:hypothetical protein [Candidatus Eremiobacteraeota bacterium]